MSPKKSSRKSPRKSPRKPAKPVKKSVRSPKKSAKKTNGSAGGFATAEDVLKSIPDADESYLKIDPEAAKMNYFQLKARQKQAEPQKGPPREIPTARSNCLNGLTIVFTGVLPTLDRETCERLASQYGARVTKSVSGRTSLVVIGHEAGPKKVKTIKQKKIKCIDEDGFVELLARMPENGGSGEAALKASAKKQREEEAAIAEAEAETKAEAEEAKKNGGSSTDSKNGSPSQLWTDKYAPTDLKQICGNKSNVKMLYDWLDRWFETEHSGKYARKAGIDNYRAVLISGPPGTGKTTAANLVAKKLGFDVVEKNASDFRSKKILNEQLRECLDNTAVAGFFSKAHSSSARSRRILLIMDEVDGMSAGDNGGVSQLAEFCRETKTPLVMICNDRSLPKMRAFDRTCYDMTWRRPTAREMRSRLMTIAHREGLRLDPNVIERLVSATHNDIRQIINIMSGVARTQKTLDFKDTAKIESTWHKEVALKPFDVVGQLLGSSSYGDNASKDINGKLSLFFTDPDIVPLMIQENYRSTSPSGAGMPKYAGLNYPSHLDLVAAASDAISESDLVNQAVHSGDQQWSLLPFYGIMSTIIPGSYICGRLTGRIFFPGWLGQNSKANKNKRIVQRLQGHTAVHTRTDGTQLRLSYVPILKESLTKPLVDQHAEGIPEVLKVMDGYGLTRDDWDSVMDLSVGRHQAGSKIPGSVKSKFTREYNAAVHPGTIDEEIKISKRSKRASKSTQRSKRQRI